MKKLNIKILAISILVSIYFISCDDDDKTTTVTGADSYASLNELLQTLKPSTESFTINPSTNQTITGPDGTIIRIIANTFTDNNNTIITAPITAKLTEHLTLEDMVLANASTISNERLLVTGGSFNLTFEDANGNPVNSNPSGIRSQIPVQTDISGYENSMRYYTGNTTIVDGREMINWDLNGNWEVGLSENNTFNILGLEQGLANCDALYSLVGEMPTQFEVTVSGVTDYRDTTIWLVIDDFPSVVRITSLNTALTALKSYDNSIPTGLKATLIAFTVDADNYLKFGSLPITVAGNDTFNIVIDYGTTADLKTLIQTVTN